MFAQFEQVLQEELLQLQSDVQPLHCGLKILLFPLLNNRIKSKKKNKRLSLQVLLFKSKRIRQKNSTDEFSEVFNPQSLVQQLLHSIKRTSFKTLLKCMKLFVKLCFFFVTQRIQKTYYTNVSTFLQKNSFIKEYKYG